MALTTGTFFLSKQRPTTATATDRAGEFRLELVLVDNLGRNPATGRDEKEAYRVRWAGPEAQAFWAAHQADLTAGAPLHAELEHLRAHPGPAVFPPIPELRGRVLRLRLLPRRASGTPSTSEAATA